MKFVKLASTTLVLVVIAVSCSSESKWTQLDTIKRMLSFPQGYYDHVVYVDDHVIGFARNTDASKEKQISFAYEGDNETTPFNPQDNSNCKRYSYFQVVSLLPDGRLGLFKECKEDPELTAFRTIFAYDWHTGKLEQLLNARLPLFGPKFFTWNPQMTLGIQETSSSYRGTIYWISPDQISPMDIEIEDRGLTWNLKDYYDGKEKTGFVRYPSWSPDGKTIAFFASTYGILEKPEPKLNVTYDLFFMNPSLLKPALELMDVADAGKIVWSPNNEYLLFGGCVGRKLICGLWRYRIIDKTLSLIQQGEFADYIWISNEKVVAAKISDLSYSSSQIWEYTIQ